MIRFIFLIVVVIAGSVSVTTSTKESTSPNSNGDFYSIFRTLVRSNSKIYETSHFTYVDVKSEKKIVILDDYVADKTLTDFKLEMNRFHPFKYINVFSFEQQRSNNRTYEFTAANNISSSKNNKYGSLIDHKIDMMANSPWVECSYLPNKFYECPSLREIGDHFHFQLINCTKFGSTKYQFVPTVNILCKVFDGIECRGNRTFYKTVPCVKFSEKSFISILLYSIFLGIFAVDRCCIGHTGVGVGKLITFGGFGVWYLIDIILLVLGYIKPSDNSVYNIYF